ncbi:hypothetical protein, partial [Streptomyces albidoflavus]|uniref:hypothetical protein n=1 Tax=Streptomyces albidoflavus TaxID=1886 RepID=UPI003F60C92E
MDQADDPVVQRVDPLPRPAERPGARTPEAAELIGGARERIDALDDRIIGLVQERIAVSAVIQDACGPSGGRRAAASPAKDVSLRPRAARGATE